MRYFGFILSLATAGNAIDVRFWHQSYVCDNGFFTACVGLNPNVCCYLPGNAAEARSVSWESIPLDWILEIRGYANRDCNPNAQKTLKTYRYPDECMTYWQPGPPVGSAGYGFSDTWKRRDKGSSKEITSTGGNCTSREQANTLSFADGTQYNITGFSAKEYTELLDFALGKKNMADIPKEYEALRIPGASKEE